MPKPLVIDLSHHNTVPGDLNDTRAAGIAGVIHKATDGTKFVDEKVRARYSLAKDAGMLFGIYHFLRPGYIKQQVDHFLSSPIWDSSTLLVCDFEVDGISLDAVLLFLELVETASSQKPVLYSGSTLKDLGGASKLTELADYRLWLAQYGPKAYLPKGFNKYWLWQYSEKGSIAGIKGAVDLNAYQGTEQELKQDWVISTSAAASNSSTPTHSVVSDATSIPQVDSEQQPSITTSVEQKETQAITSGDTTTTQQTTVTADKNVAVGKEEHIGFLASMWAKITGAIATIGGFSAVTNAAQQAQVFGFTPEFWQSIFTIVAVGVTIWIIVEAIKWFFTVWLRRHRTEKLAELNSTPNNTVVIVPEDQLDQYEKKGWVVIRRN